MFIHAVLMSFRSTASVEFHRKVGGYAERVLQECGGIVSYLYDANGASRAEGYTHAVVAVFVDESAHDSYQISAVHLEMKSFMATHIDRLVVFDSSNWS